LTGDVVIAHATAGEVTLIIGDFFGGRNYEVALAEQDE